ncbi:MAG: ribonuclease R [Planctomycetota bacterium]|nr:ribonuclease R [Planctomycetota bacterium]
MLNELAEAILAHVHRPDYRPLKPRGIAKQLKLSEDRHREVKKAVKLLVKHGHLKYGENHLVLAGSTTLEQARAAAIGKSTTVDGVAQEVVSANGDTPPRVKKHKAPRPDAEAADPTLKFKDRDNKTDKKLTIPSNRVAGLFRRTQSGSGYVRPSGSPAGSDRKLDIFIPADRTMDAASGDTVLVRLNKNRDIRRENPVGEIVEILERDTHQFVGTYLEKAGNSYVQVDGKVFSRPVLVGDPGAKNAQIDDKVVFEMVRFPSQFHDGEGVITEVLGARGAPGVDTLSIIREFDLPEEFAEDALEEARKQAERFDESIRGHRIDLTGETIITIDPVDARDFDDAISLKRHDNGHWRLGVHIADVSHFVQPKTALDREAVSRATSVYLPDRVIPMLPEIISNNLASLQPDRVRYTKTVFIEFTAEGQVTVVDPHAAAIKSCRRFAYEEVDEYLADREAWKAKLTPQVHQLLSDMHELAMILRARRMRRGSLELDMKEVKVDLNKQGQVTGAHVVENTVSHQIIEEFMLAANEAVAELLEREGYHFLRRVHADPDPRRLIALTDFVTGLGFKIESLESRFELQRVLKMVKDKPEQHAVNYAVLRSLQRAVYSPEDEGHYALASETYCHFTSPIRRYPDLTVHRLFEAVLVKKRAVNDYAELVVMGEHCSDRERRAEAAERELTKLKLLNFLSTRIGDQMDAVITGVEEFGLFAQGIALPAEGMIHVTSLADDFYTYDRKAHTLTGRRAGNSFRLGDMVRVTVAHVDVDRRQLDFRLVDRMQRAPAAAEGKKPARGKTAVKFASKFASKAKASSRPKKKSSSKGPLPRKKKR